MIQKIVCMYPCAKDILSPKAHIGQTSLGTDKYRKMAKF